MVRPGLLVAAILASLSLSLLARQDGPSVFRSGADVVEVEVSVLDRNRLPVRGLAAEDFAVFEDGAPRPVVAFTPVELRPRELPTAPWLVDAPTDVQTNAFPREGRLITVVLDRSIRSEHLITASEIANDAIEQMRPGDLAAVVWTGRGMSQNFTADRSLLRSAIFQPFVNLPASDLGNSGDCYCGACSIQAVASIAEAIQDVRQRRKLLLYIGSNFSIQSAGLCGGSLEGPRRRALRAAEIGNLTVHTFDVNGLETLAPGAQSRSPQSGLQGYMARRANLSLLPDATGGRAVAVNDPARALPEIFRESDAYYVLGFQPTHTDGRFHRIDVTVPGREVTLVARRGYNAAGGRPGRAAPVRAGDVSPALRAAISGIWPRTTIPLTVSAIPVATPGLRSATVAVVVGVRRERREPGGELLDAASSVAPARVNVLVGAYGRNGNALAEARQTVDVTPGPDASRPFVYEIVSRLELPPGRYEVRAAVEDPALAAAGSVHTHVDVPDFVRSPVALSGILLQRVPARQPSVGVRFDDLVPVVPTLDRAFRRDDQVLMFVKSYQGLTRAAMPGYTVVEILDADGRRVFHREQRVLAGDFGANRAHDIVVDLPTDRLSPGPHLLRVEVRHGSETATRESRFDMRWE